jgi:hypothetical protein
MIALGREQWGWTFCCVSPARFADSFFTSAKRPTPLISQGLACVT